MTGTGADGRTGLDPSLVDELRRRRAELRDSIGALEDALAAPGDRSRWGDRVQAALVELAGDLRAHVEITEGPAGLYAELLAGAPRLAGEVDRLTREHTEIASLLEDLLALTAPHTAAEVPADDVRRAGTNLLGALVRHRQRGSDLLYGAYELDIGGET